jgi:adenosylcobinamide-GDP ribazoletransferase
VLACLICRYARKEGKAKFFIEYARKEEIIIGALFVFGLFLFLARLKGTLIFIASLLPILLFIEYAKRKIGGMTGDTIGATSEIAEVSTLFAVVVFGSIWN